MGRDKINILVKKNIKLFFATTLLLSVYSIFGNAIAYEIVEAETILPKNKNTDNAQLSAGVEKKEFVIPNPFDEILLRKIKEAEKVNQQTALTEKKSDILIDSKKLEYFDETGELEATGDVIIASSNGTVVTADRAVYDKNLNVNKLYDNVVLKK